MSFIIKSALILCLNTLTVKQTHTLKDALTKNAHTKTCTHINTHTAKHTHS